ncbi:hyaluronan / mRNA binding family [Wolffia australiana]
MATGNPFHILGDDDNDDPSHLIAVQQQKLAAKKPSPAAAPTPAAGKLPSKPAPPTQSVRDAREPARGGGFGGGRGGLGRGRGRGGFLGQQNRDFGNGNVNGYPHGGAAEGEGEKSVDRERSSFGGPRQPFRGGGRRGGYRGGEGDGDSERPRRTFERRSGTGRGNEIKREGSGRGNWGTHADDVLPQEGEESANVEEKNGEKQPEVVDVPATEADVEVKEGAKENEEPEDKEMTLEEYEKIREEKRKALLALKAEERKVEVDKELKSMQLLSVKKDNDEIFIKLGTDKDAKRKDAEREEKAKKSVSINQFLKPAEGERFYGGRGRGARGGRAGRGPFRGGSVEYGSGGGGSFGVPAPAIDDPGHFPTLGVK